MEPGPRSVANLELNVELKGFAWVQALCVGGLVGGGVVAYLIQNLSGHDTVYGLVPMLDVGNEKGIATFFSALNLLLASVLTYSLCTLSHNVRVGRGWMWLAWVFVYLAFDEATAFHENFERLDVLLPEDGLIQSRHAWLLFGFSFAAVATVVFLPLLRHLPRTTAGLVLLAGALFATGALGFELLGSWMIKRGIGIDTLFYDLRRVAEEGLEMSAIALYNWTLVRELSIGRASATIAVRPSAVRSTSAIR